MTDNTVQTPINAYFAAAKQGDSRWWTWLVVAWAGILVWFFGQILFGIPLVLAAMFTDPAGPEAFMATLPAQEGYSFKDQLAFAATVLGPIIAFFAWLIQGGRNSNGNRVAIAIAFSQVILSSVAVIYLIASGSGGDTSMVGDWIARAPAVYMFMLLAFPPLAIGLWFGVKFIQKRRVLTLHTAAKKFRWKRLFFSMAVLWAVWSLVAAVNHYTGVSKAEFVFEPARYWPFLIITLLFIPMQSATEEIMFRGFLNQGLGQYIKNPWVIFIITSAGFAALHMGNPEVAEAVKEHSIFYALSGYFAFGMFLCVLTYIDGGIETAIGVHAANNIFAAAVVGYTNSALPVPTIFQINLDTTLDTMSTIIGLGVVCVIMYKTRRPL